MKKTTAKKLAADYEAKDGASMTDKQAKALLINAAKSVLDAIPRQAAALQAIGDALTLYAETDAARLKMDADFEPESLESKKKFFEEVKASAMEAFDKIIGQNRHEETPEDKAFAEKAKKVAAKRHALIVAQWNKSEKPKHGSECEYQACVCPLFLAEPARGFLAAQGYPTAFAHAPATYSVDG